MSSKFSESLTSQKLTFSDKGCTKLQRHFAQTTQYLRVLSMELVSCHFLWLFAVFKVTPRLVKVYGHLPLMCPFQFVTCQTDVSFSGCKEVAKTPM